ncbi:two-component system sensor histidine kinase VicK [Croceifilum oryzae]|uniref:histidine kinase n=1 Tax=Croceifilum oryzae TaxID=1553429 RepID=A0AAJ1TNP9_9BACL|nr:ATP-binding protein [Croceifilum oryzae]MDQ0417826.1 two-component system sensor histidine kinase VicK [Croceifilum oryzae]
MRNWIQSVRQGNVAERWFAYATGLQWKLLVILALIILVALQVIFVNFSDRLEKQLLTNVTNDLNRQKNVISKVIEETIHNRKKDENPNVLKDKINEDLARVVFLQTKNNQLINVQILNNNGFIVAATGDGKSKIGYKNPYVHSLPFNQEEIRRSPSSKSQDVLMKVYSLDITNPDFEFDRIYMEYPLDTTYQLIRSIIKTLIIQTFYAMIIVSILIVIMTRTITVPVKEIKEQATAMAEGDFNRRVDVRSTDEIGKLAKAFNHLASHLQTALTQKEEEKEKLETVLSDMSDGVIATNRSGAIIVKNERSEQILNREIKLGEMLNSVLPLSEPVQFPITQELHNLIQVQHDDQDDPLYIKLTFTPLKQKRNKPTGTIVVLKDVTEEERLDRQRKEFVANVSHELRTPLTTIKSYLEALEDGALEQPELAVRFLQVSRTEADRMTRLINDLLQLSKLDAKQSRFDKKIMYLEDVLEDVADRFIFQCKQKEIKLTLRHADEELPRIYADRDKMDQVLDNLLSNAVKFTPQGGSVTISSRLRPDGLIEVAITDTGMGIPKKDLERIFERFYRVDKARAREQGGTGLGLAIVQEIIKAHEGIVWIESKERKGTTVFFALPPFERRVHS